MKKFIYILLIAIISMCGIMLVSHFSSEESFYIQVDNTHRISSYEANRCYVDIYQQNDHIIINAYSDGSFDEPSQIVIPFKGKITNDDISIKWKTLGGKVVEQDSDSIIEKDGTILCNENINLFEN